MAAAATSPRTALALNHGTIERSMVSSAQAERLRINGVFKIDDTLAVLGNFAANTACYCDFPVGKFTYRQWGFSLVAPALIASVTTLRDGKHWVNSNKITDYIDTLTIEIDGKGVWEMTAAELLMFNDYQNIATSDGTLRIPFGSPGQHIEDMAEDAYSLGTSGLRQLRLKVKTKPAFVAGMLPVINVEYLPTARKTGYFVGTTRYSYNAAAAGKFAISDLAVGKDFSTIWVQSASINRGKLQVDDDIVFDCYNSTLRSIHESFGRDCAALGAGLIYDSFRDGDAIGLDSVTNSNAERGRGADVRLEFEMAAAAGMVIIVFHCGLYKDQ